MLRHKKGTLKDLLECYREGSKIINALDFPMVSAPHPPTVFVSDLAAFHAMVDLPFCRCTVPFPAMVCRWGLAATTGAFHLWHTDCNGFAMYIDTQVGYKWWVVAHPKEHGDLSNLSFFSERFDLSAVNEDLCHIEAILLPPGSCLYVVFTNHLRLN